MVKSVILYLNSKKKHEKNHFKISQPAKQLPFVSSQGAFGKSAGVEGFHHGENEWIFGRKWWVCY